MVPVDTPVRHGRMLSLQEKAGRMTTLPVFQEFLYNDHKMYSVSNQQIWDDVPRTVPDKALDSY